MESVSKSKMKFSLDRCISNFEGLNRLCNVQPSTLTLNHCAIKGSIQVRYFTVERDGKMFIIHYLVMSPPAAQHNQQKYNNLVDYLQSQFFPIANTLTKSERANEKERECATARLLTTTEKCLKISLLGALFHFILFIRTVCFRFVSIGNQSHLINNFPRVVYKAYLIITISMFVEYLNKHDDAANGSRRFV